MKKLAAMLAGVVGILLAAPSVSPAGAVSGSAYDFEFTSIDGKPLKLADWQGKVLLVVNTASFCGFTKQYAGLQELWSKYETAGLVVLGVPSNDFGEQEPKSEADVKAFCEGGFGVTFPLTAKQAVKGEHAHPFYKWAAAAVGPQGVPSWNVHKYLVGRDGRIVKAFSSRVTPSSAEVVDAVEAALAAAGH